MCDPNAIPVVSESEAQRLQREAHINACQRIAADLAAARLYTASDMVRSLDWGGTALRLYPDPPLPLKPREQKHPLNGATYRWNDRAQCIEREPGIFGARHAAWSRDTGGTSRSWIEFAHDLMTWPFVDALGKPCRRESDGSVSYREEKA